MGETLLRSPVLAGDLRMRDGISTNDFRSASYLEAFGLMHNVFVSFTPMNLFIMLAEDPNFRPGVFLKLNGVTEKVTQFTLELLDGQLETVFKRDYQNLNLSKHSFLEFYTGPGQMGELLRLRLDDFEKTVDLRSGDPS